MIYLASYMESNDDISEASSHCYLRGFIEEYMTCRAGWGLIALPSLTSSMFMLTIRDSGIVVAAFCRSSYRLDCLDTLH